MAKKKKKFVADHVRSKKAEGQKKVNPFEVKINRQKHVILGRKISKHDKGMPGLSRSKAIKKRKATLLQEYKHRFKANKLVDKRFGENDTRLSLDEKMLKRFALEREKHEDRGNKFSLNDEEDLTHYGQSLSEIEKFDDPIVSDEEDDQDHGKITAEMVAEEHFGGFLKKRVESNDKKSWKERMEEMITKSKKEKHERQTEKEKALELTNQLDEEWKDVCHLMGGLSKYSSSKVKEHPESRIDEYDIAVRELKFEMKGQATDRLKTEEELAKEEKEKLEKLEADRIMRMKGIVESRVTPHQKHFSADDLNDGFVLDSDNKKNRFVRFSDGKVIEGGQKNEIQSSDDEDENNNDSNGSDDDDSDDRNRDEDDDNDGDEDQEDDEGAKEEETGETDNAINVDSEDSYGDIKSDEDENMDDAIRNKKDIDGEAQKKLKEPKPILKKRPLSAADLKMKKDVMQAAKAELPYTFQVPDTYEDLLRLVQNHSCEDTLTIIERMRKCHHVSLAEGNKEKLEKLLCLLIQYFGDLALDKPPRLSLMDGLTLHLYQLTQQSPVSAANAVQSQILGRQAEFQQYGKRRKGMGVGVDTLLVLKLVSVLFPTSDFRHPVTTPALMFICQMLSQCSVTKETDAVTGLFLVSLCLEYVSLSKRYIPEAVNFLHGLLFLASVKQPGKYENVVPPFRPVGKHNDLLLVRDDKTKNCELKQFKVSQILTCDVESESLSTDEFRLNAINSCVRLLKEFSILYSDLPSYQEVFSPVKVMCAKLPVQHYPIELQENLSSLNSLISDLSSRTRQPLVLQKAKPKPLKMFEPKIEEVWDGRKKKSGGTREFNEKQRLIHKYKKELKGAIRDIRNDTRFLARHQYQETMERDAERKRKVKELHACLATQEGEYKALKKQKS